MHPSVGLCVVPSIALVVGIVEWVGAGAGKGEGPWSKFAASINSDPRSGRPFVSLDNATPTDHFAFSCNFVKKGYREVNKRKWGTEIVRTKAMRARGANGVAFLYSLTVSSKSSKA